MPSITHCGHTLTWTEHSAGAHTLIFINGYSANRAIWAREVARMAVYGRCVSLDLPGHYPASAPPDYRRLSQDLLLELELHAIADLAGAGSVTLVGHSTGGLVALAAAALAPTRVTRVIALDPVVWGPLAGSLGLFQRLLALPGGYGLYWLTYWATQRSWPFAAWATARSYSGDPTAYRHNPVARAALEVWYPDYRHTQIHNLATLLRALEHADIRPLASRIACPALIIAGTRDPIVPITQARWLAENLPDATLEEISTAGHLPHWEAAERVDQVIDQWLAAHPVT